MENGNNNSLTTMSREKLDQVATWVSTTVVSAFFSSLERCSCVNLTTSDRDDDDSFFVSQEPPPLSLSADPHPSEDML